MSIPREPFEASPGQLEAHIEHYVDSFMSGLQSFFTVMPKGSGFVEFSRFRQAYETLKLSTRSFDDFSPDAVLTALSQDPLILIVLRSMLGLSPPEFAHMAGAVTNVEIDQSAARRLDKRSREGKLLLATTNPKTREQVRALVRAAVQLINEGAPVVSESVLHRLDKIDTKDGIDAVRRLAATGVPYEALLYERFLGRPFATHRDAVSEKVGEIIEEAVKERLDSARIPYHRTGIAERFEDMDQAPDFLVPSQVSPGVVIEAKLAEDDGTARDKVTRVQHLAELREQRLRAGGAAFDVVACVDGRGFGIRREDIKKLLLATAGKVFNLRTVDGLVANTRLKDFLT
jgi:hypothetical protein